MENLWLFLLGIAFVKWVVPFLDILLEWFTNVISKKINLIQSDIAVTSKNVNDYCKDGQDKGMTHAIGFKMDEQEEEFVDDDSEEDDFDDRKKK